MRDETKKNSPRNFKISQYNGANRKNIQPHATKTPDFTLKYKFFSIFSSRLSFKSTKIFFHSISLRQFPINYPDFYANYLNSINKNWEHEFSIQCNTKLSNNMIYTQWWSNTNWPRGIYVTFVKPHGYSYMFFSFIPFIYDLYTK